MRHEHDLHNRYCAVCLCVVQRAIRTHWQRRRSRQYQSAHIVNYNTESLAVGVGRSYGAYSGAAQLTVDSGQWERSERRTVGRGARRRRSATACRALYTGFPVSSLHAACRILKRQRRIQLPSATQATAQLPNDSPPPPHSTQDISVTPLASIEAPDALGSASVKCTSS